MVPTTDDRSGQAAKMMCQKESLSGGPCPPYPGNYASNPTCRYGLALYQTVLRTFDPNVRGWSTYPLLDRVNATLVRFLVG